MPPCIHILRPLDPSGKCLRARSGRWSCRDRWGHSAHRGHSPSACGRRYELVRAWYLWRGRRRCRLLLAVDGHPHSDQDGQDHDDHYHDDHGTHLLLQKSLPPIRKTRLIVHAPCLLRNPPATVVTTSHSAGRPAQGMTYIHSPLAQTIPAWPGKTFISFSFFPFPEVTHHRAPRGARTSP